MTNDAVFNLGAILGKDGKDGINGKDGTNGADGKDGANGKDGLGVADIKIDENGISSLQ